MAHGAPESLDDIPQYLKNIRGGTESSPEVVQMIRDRYSAIGGSAGGAAGTVLSQGNPAAALGAGTVGLAAGAAIPPTIESVKLLMQASKMTGGRQLLKTLLTNSDGALTPQVMGVIGAFVAQTPMSQLSNIISPPTGLPRAFPMQQ